MANITIKMKDGKERVFKHEGRPGGSYTKKLLIVPGFAVIEDEYFRRTYIPERDIQEISEVPNR